ncbi:MAG: alpha amylase C-terminal domain-containing protein, partial [Dehalococcoidia bacterium]
KEQMEVLSYDNDQVLFLRRWSGNSEAFAVFSFGDAESAIALGVTEGRWRKVLDSADERWQGGGTSLPDLLPSNGEVALTPSPMSLAIFVKEVEP